MFQGIEHLYTQTNPIFTLVFNRQVLESLICTLICMLVYVHCDNAKNLFTVEDVLYKHDIAFGREPYQLEPIGLSGNMRFEQASSFLYLLK